MDHIIQSGHSEYYERALTYLPRHNCPFKRQSVFERALKYFEKSQLSYGVNYFWKFWKFFYGCVETLTLESYIVIWLFGNYFIINQYCPFKGQLGLARYAQNSVPWELILIMFVVIYRTSFLSWFMGIHGFKNIFSEKLQTKQAEMVQWNPSEVDNEPGLSGQRFSFYFNQPIFSKFFLNS